MKILKSEDFLMVKKLKKYVKKYYILIILNILLALISSAVSAAPVTLIKKLFDKGIHGKNETAILYAVGGMILLSILGAFLVYWTTMLSGKISSSIYKNIVDDLYVKIQSLDMEYFSRTKVGELMTKVLNDPANVNTFILEFFEFLKYIFTAISYLVIAIHTDWKLTIGMFVSAPILMITVKKYSKKLKKSGKERQETTGILNSKLQETLSGIRVIRAFATEKQEIHNFKKISLELKKVVMKTVGYNAKSNSVSEALNYVMMAILLLFGGYRILRGRVFTTGDFLTIMSAIGSMYTPVRRSANIYNSLSTNIPSIGRIFEILDVVPEIADAPDCVNFEEFKSDITFENADFSYKDSDEKVLKNINLVAKKGETVALVGNSGGGKSTLVNLIPRFFDVTGGKITIDGIDVKNYKIKSLRKKIGIVPQETFLFGGTILENIRYANQNASVEEVIEAAKKANAHEFIEKLEQGYETEIGERGIKLSGGQKQRISIARAILENPQILILDEATSALDNESEQLVQDALEKLMKGKTTFVIAHRLSTIINSDKIVVIQQGEIRETGTHEELLNKDGIYKSLYNKSFKN